MLQRGTYGTNLIQHLTNLCVQSFLIKPKQRRTADKHKLGLISCLAGCDTSNLDRSSEHVRSIHDSLGVLSYLYL